MACILTSFRSLLQRPFSLWTFSWFSHLKLYPLPHFIPYSYLILPLHLSLFGSQHMQVVLVVKNPPASAGDVRDVGSIPESGRSPGGGHGNPLQYSWLGNLMDRGTWRAIVHGVARVRHDLATKLLLLQIREWDHKEGWALKNWCFWIVVLVKTLENPLGSKEIKPVNLKGNQHWNLLEELMLKMMFQFFGHLMQRANSLEKNLMLRRLRVGGEGGDRGWDGGMASLTQWMWVWANSRR